MLRKVAIIVLTWNNYQDTKECLESLRHLTYPNYEVMVVDNGSTDGSIERLQKEFPEFTYILNDKNLGFAGGNNVGMRYALQRGFDYIMLLNDDTVVEKNLLEPLIEHLERDKNTASVQPLLLKKSNPSIIDTMGIEITRSGGAFNINAGLKITSVPTTEKIGIFGTCAAASIYRASVIKEVGLFDESYLFLHEDVDLAWRIKLAGYNAYLISGVKVYHKGGVTLRKGDPWRNFILRKNRLNNLVRYFPLSTLLFYSPLHIVPFLRCLFFDYKRLLKELDASLQSRRKIAKNPNLKKIQRKWLSNRGGYCWHLRFFLKRLIHRD